MHITKDIRGFAMAEFTDRYDHKCYIKKSSLATEDCIWLGLENANPMVMASDAAKVGVKTTELVGWVPYPIPDEVLLYTTMHLTQEQVAALIPVLQRFVETGEITK